MSVHDLPQHQTGYHAPRIVGHCVGAHGKTCGKPLASKTHAKALGALPNSGGMRCRSCHRRNARPVETVRKSRSALIAAVMQRPEWMRYAVCNQMGGDTFFPEEHDRGGANAARQVCWEVCHNRPACLSYALANDEPEGIWGGYTPSERRRLVREGLAA